jgi:hypothetical protein
MDIPLLDQLQKLIVEHGSATVRGDHIALLREQREALEKKVAALESENRQLKEEVSKLTRKLEAACTPDEFIKYRGVFFRRLPSGEIENAVYCLKCKGPMFSLRGSVPYQCSACNVVADFNGRWLPELLVEVTTKFPHIPRPNTT